MDAIDRGMDALSVAHLVAGNDSQGPPNGADGIGQHDTKREGRFSVWYNALRDDDLFCLLVGWADEEDVAEVPVTYSSLGLPNKANAYGGVTGEDTKMVQPFRKAASGLPFAVRFVLELHLLDGEVIEVQQARQPREGATDAWEARKEEIAIRARRLVVALVEEVIPPLTEVDWRSGAVGHGGWGTDVDGFTLSELFASAVEEEIVRVKRAVRAMEEVSFDRSHIESAMKKARRWLNRAMRFCRASEQDLARGEGADIHLIKQRAMWPYAEYSCRFLSHGELVPEDYEVVNLGRNSLGPHSRRGIREAGWLVRDRFCRITNSFEVSENLADWVGSRPSLCGREYVFLFDKGVGTNMKIWLLSKHGRGTSRARPDLEVTRDRFLAGLGDLGDIKIGKLGDRIGLAFSQTAPIVRLAEDRIATIPDLVRNGYAFSDGCGVMGAGVARAVQEALGLPALPGAVQFRLGGLKGMLSLNLDFDPDGIGIRPSQVKFRSSHRVLEVKDFAQCSLEGSHKLFKEALLVMDYLGVKCSVLYNLQERSCAEMVLPYDVEGAFETFKRSRGEEVDESHYLKDTLEHGRRMDGEPFLESELEEIKDSMTAAKDRVNINLRASLMFGVIDEHDALEEGEVLVCNGAITGEVAVLRSPCMFPGDVQRAIAVPGKPGKSFTCLDQCIVFSARGERPFQDALGGGDLDGDTYFVVREQEVVHLLKPVKPHDFGTRNSSVRHEIDISQVVCAPEEHISVDAPNIQDQLDVLKRFMQNWNLVSDTANAWLRMADMYGVGHVNSQRLATLHQRALDSRKTMEESDESDLKYMQDVLAFMPNPHYRTGRAAKGEKHSSFLGILYEFWRHNIKAVDILIERSKLQPSQCSASLDLQVAENEQLKLSTTNCMINLDWKKEKTHHYCVTCGEMNNCKAMKECAICGAVWACAGSCEVKHWRICFGIHWRDGSFAIDDADEDSSVSSSTLESGSIIDSKEITADTVSLTSFEESIISFSETRDTSLNDLIGIVFGSSDKPSCPRRQMSWEALCDEDLRTLKQLVLVEFYAGFQKECRDARKKTKDKIDVPHVFDVFVMDRKLERGNISLAVCLRNEKADGLLTWRDGQGDDYPIKPPFHLFRVASLSGTCRILDSLNTTPLPGSLMHSALTRNADAFVKVNEDTLQLSPEIFSSRLNKSQKQAIATVCSSSFGDGYLLVHGPPGTGKTLTLAHMVASIGGGIIAAPSNAAVANVAIKMLTFSQFDVRSVVVFGENCHESLHFLSPTHRSRHFHTFKEKYWKASMSKDPRVLLDDFADWLGLDKTSMLKSNLGTKEKLLVGFVKWLRLPGNMSIQEIEAHCQRVDESFKGQRILTQIISGAKVVLCTLNTAGSSFLRNAVGGKFHTFFLDEAAQCPEAEFYICTTFPGIKRIVLIGDPRQLNATVLDMDCNHMGYGDSWMQHAMDLDSTKVHMLNTQYRCHPDILEFPNKSFYGGRIRSHKSCYRKPEVTFPLRWINTSPYGEEENEGLSLKNHFEAETILGILRKDTDIRNIIAFLKQGTQVLIVTPYRAQVDLVRGLLDKENSFVNIKVNTVDAFQGQEADIVIFSLVRTKRVGFTDDPQRVNVALTRAKRAVRIIGDIEFWSEQPSSQSILKKLVDHCKERGAVADDSRVKRNEKKMQAWRKPNWSLVDSCTFKPNMTALFHHCLKEFITIDKFVALNTLLKLALPSLKDLSSLPREDTEKPWWQMTALKGYEQEMQIVWCAKEGGSNVKPVIQAHYAGSKKKCLHFQQTHPALPNGAVCVKRNLAGVASADHTMVQSQRIELSWTLTKSIGDAILDVESFPELPEGCFDLDPDQTVILQKPLPLMLESGSGTGKTNVLFQHAVAHAYAIRDGAENTPICFVTVSPRLRRELHQRYSYISSNEKLALPTIKFFSFGELLGGLISFAQIGMMKVEDCATFIEYCTFVKQKTHGTIPVDVKEAENEISGVITGSLDAAMEGRALTREEYINSVRSYISKDTKAGKEKRHAIYSEYEKYRKWKQDKQDKYDMNDIVLELIKSKRLKLISSMHNGNGSRRRSSIWIQLFNACYLDEIQDFTYASIYLICHIAGYSSLRWIFAGDTAQMISPGCSFTFKGLKDVLLAVQPDIEQRIKHVNKLGKNYRVTKDVLNVSNSILNVAKNYFRNDIQYFRPEIAMNDLGTRVRVCRWREALEMEKAPRFGPNQALIYSSTSDVNDLSSKMNTWLNEHPFILTCLDSKGLEFDDCVIAFDIEKKAWDIDAGKVASLRLLRELYVAITRAKRRVVILTNNKKMREFFTSLKGCNIEESDAKVALLEFDAETTQAQWLKRGRELFEDGQFKPAAGCFKAAGDFGHFEWAQGRYEIEIGQKDSGKEAFRRSARLFFEKADFENTLNLLSLVMEQATWNPDDDDIYDVSRKALPSYFTREKEIQFALQRNKWNEVSFEDLKECSSAPLFIPFRKKAELMNLISPCTQEDLSDIEYTFPLLVADYYFEKGEYLKAAKLYLEQSNIADEDLAMAEEATNRLIHSSKEGLDTLAQCWLRWKSKQGSKIVSGGDVSLLMKFYENPAEVARSRPTEVYKKFGPDIIKSAFKNSRKMEELHNFGHKRFETEVNQALSNKFKGNLIEAVLWYLERNDKAHAEKFASRSIDSLIEQADQRHTLLDLVRLFLGDKVFNLRLAVRVSDAALSSIKKAEAYYDKLIGEWDKRRNDNRVKNMLERKQPQPPGPNTVVFLNLFWDPSHSSTRLSKHCMELFGPEIVERAVSIVFGNDHQKYDILSSFDEEAFKHLDSTKFKKGDRVILCDLRNESMNGKRGAVLKWQPDNKRYAVRIDNRNFSLLASKMKIDTSSPQPKKGIFQDKAKSKQVKPKPKPKAKSKVDWASSDDNSEPPPLNDRDQSSSDGSESSSDASSNSDSVPSLVERGNRSNDSDSSEADSSMSNHNDNQSDTSSESDASSDIPLLTKKDNSSSDESDTMPQLIGPNDQQSDSDSSDDSLPPSRAPKGRVPYLSNTRRGERSTQGRGETGGGRGAGRGGRRGRRRKK